jgi:hypothetical protein
MWLFVPRPGSEQHSDYAVYQDVGDSLRAGSEVGGGESTAEESQCLGRFIFSRVGFHEFTESASSFS